MRFEGIEWQEIKTEDVEMIGKVEGQIWLALYNLMCEPECRKKYEYDQRRQEIVLGVCIFFVCLVYLQPCSPLSFRFERT